MIHFRHFLFLMLLPCSLIGLNLNAYGQDSNKIESFQFNPTSVIFSIPSPIQSMFLIHQENVPFDSLIVRHNYMRPTATNTVINALKLGTYLADIGYLIMMEQPVDKSMMLNINLLAKPFGIQSITKSLTEQLNRLEGNKDSLLFCLSNNMRTIDATLKDRSRVHIATIILAAGAIESPYILTKAALSYSNQNLANRIAEQKSTYENLKKYIKSQPESKELKELWLLFQDIDHAFSGVKMDYQFHEPTVDTVKHITVINSTTKSNISTEKLQIFYDKLNSIRRIITISN